MIATIPLITSLVGLLMYVLCANPKLIEIGRILLFCGVLTALMAAGR